MAVDVTTHPTITLDPDSHECPHCGIVSVPSDDRSARPVDEHVCR